MLTPVIEITFSKKRYAIQLLIFLGLCVVGMFLLIDPSFETPPISATAFRIVGIIVIGIFGFMAYSRIKKILDRELALTISNEGIYDNSSKFSFGFIPWKDVVEIKKKRRSDNKFLLFFVNNPIEYIEKQAYQNSQKVLLDYQNIFGTPLCLTAKSLSCSFDELQGLIERRLNLYKKNMLDA